MNNMKECQETNAKYSELVKLCDSASEKIRRRKDLLVVSHVDADGLTASAIVCTALDRLGLDYRPIFFKQLDSTALDQVADQGADLAIFTDLGSGMIKEICDLGLEAVIADHHKPATHKEARPVAHID
ncbi:MAG: recombinase RecJ, partial [Methanotrichaceae archaeon]|nr:recombinase RecJ [Methanotrichaceae archaeon]